ncbi:MAG: hypothetical protein WC919_02140 [Candidatus Paceibacterota bacterium]|jgi:hypothetical protein
MARTPNPYQAEEVRRAFQNAQSDAASKAAEIAALQTSVTLLNSSVSTIQGDITTINGEITTIDGRLDVLEAGTGTDSAEADGSLVPGNPLYMKSSSHVDRACANILGTESVVGICTTTTAQTFSASFNPDGRITIADWTAVLGSASLTPGADYFLKETIAVQPSYSNTGGTGDRHSWITSTSNLSWSTDFWHLVDGDFTIHLWGGALGGNAGKYMRWNFGVGAQKRIVEAKWYQTSTHSHGDWQWQGSNDGSTWTDIGSSFTLGGATTQTITALSTNTSFYRYYQMIGVSGSFNTNPYILEIEFKIQDISQSIDDVGMITAVAPTTVGSYVIRVGRAVSSNTLDIEISKPILL